MSNVIEFRNASVTFTSEEFNIGAFLEVMEKVEQCQTVQEAEALNDQAMESFWWHIADQGRIDGAIYEVQYFDRMGLDPKEITIHFGEGRSSHSWRDFNWMVAHAFNKFVLKTKSVKLDISDTGAPGWGLEEVVFSSNSDEAGIISWSTALKESIAKYNK